ncbi:hypothetical protein DSO57_1014835 [Entomophthora muscae]|uniref:Uncharacterized protein n=1 Tax=Entomophthora muscae TaxID=34485 RepID=A0ACC2RK89_9FUNG|nr:hypothetical protein DSO57_1014835 [Entomophthora muscae]
MLYLVLIVQMRNTKKNLRLLTRGQMKIILIGKILKEKVLKNDKFKSALTLVMKLKSLSVPCAKGQGLKPVTSVGFFYAQNVMPDLPEFSEYEPLTERTSRTTKWTCFNCHQFDGELDAILTFKKVGVEQVYCVTWKNRSYHDATWTSLAWLKNKSQAKVKKFLTRMERLEEIPSFKDVVEDDWLAPEMVLDVELINSKIKSAFKLSNISEVLVKWKGVSFDRSSWEPFVPKLKVYNELVPLIEKYFKSLSIPPPQEVSPKDLKFVELIKQPPFLTQGKLYPYQLNGLNWLYYQWCNRKPAILADEMGLGKTIQVICFLNLIYHKANAYPFLIIVPKAVIPNWFREFMFWAPELVVAIYTGGAAEREVLKGSGLFNSNGTLRAHVLLTTYDTLSSETFRFNRIHHWEALILDEGQRLKNSETAGFKKVNSIKAAHRVLLTGTPLQNNLNELYTLMSFMDPQRFQSEEEFLAKYSDLSEESVVDLHKLLAPYFLRRTKDAVLKDLPKKVEVMLPISMTPLQKEIYKAALSRDIDLLKSIAPGQLIENVKIKPQSLVNIFMELRKVLNHPYLIPGVEPTDDGASQEEVQRRLIESCGKLRLLHRILKLLKSNGHRVLIFSQFKIVLDILEDYLVGEKNKYLRIDGDITSEKRQSYIDQFNHKNSDIFVFLLTTRAGGVGMNLATADTVILYDLDFNPHSDLQALSRAHRIGQLNNVLVLRMVTRNSIEERMIEIAKRKMVLDKLIVQKMGETALDTEDIRSIIRHGAKALFAEDETNKEINYTDQELDSLLDRSTKANQSSQETDQGAFGFSRVWTTTDAEAEQATDEFWANLLKERTSEQVAPEQLGRGARRRTSRVVPNVARWTESEESDKGDKQYTPAPESPDEDDYDSSPQLSPSHLTSSIASKIHPKPNTNAAASLPLNGIAALATDTSLNYLTSTNPYSISKPILSHNIPIRPQQPLTYSQPAVSGNSRAKASALRPPLHANGSVQERPYIFVQTPQPPHPQLSKLGHPSHAYAQGLPRSSAHPSIQGHTQVLAHPSTFRPPSNNVQAHPFSLAQLQKLQGSIQSSLSQIPIQQSLPYTEHHTISPQLCSSSPGQAIPRSSPMPVFVKRPSYADPFLAGYYCAWCQNNHNTQCPMYIFNLDVQVLKQKVSSQPELLREPFYALFSNWNSAQAKLAPYTGSPPNQDRIRAPFPDARNFAPKQSPN